MPDTYKVVEVKAPAGYDLDPTPQTVTISATGNNALTGALTFKDNQLLTVSGHKTWNDHNNRGQQRPDSITVRLLANGSPVASKTVTAADKWNYSFTGLSRFDQSGKAITYSISEDTVPGYYTDVDKYNVTNTSNDQQFVHITGQKIWDDEGNRDQVRPASVTVDLLANGKLLAKQTTDSTNNWMYRFNNLPKLDTKGKLIMYTIAEDQVPTGYTSTVKGYNVTNHHTPEVVQPRTTHLGGQKIWKDDNDSDFMRPDSITVDLVLNGKTVVNKKTVTATDGWRYIFNNLPTTVKGIAATYTVNEEQTPKGYISETQGNNIINTHVPNSNISVPVKKIWDDDNNLDHLRPGSIFVNLLANGAVVAQHKVTAANGWHYTFTQLPEKINGHDVKYTVAEENVPDGYTASVDGDTITNHLTPDHAKPQTTHLGGQKIWKDDNDSDFMRPSSITVDLILNGKTVVNKKTVTATDGWRYIFNNLPTTVNGHAASYTVAEEQTPKGYISETQGNNIINTHVPNSNISIPVKKVWDDEKNRDQIRPDDVFVDLLANGATVAQHKVTAANGWHYTFTQLPQKINGHNVKYTVAEENVPAGYTASVDGDTITNHHTPEKVKPQTKRLTGHKIWKDDNDSDFMRPSSITVDLILNGKTIVNRQTVTATNNWQYAFNNLPTTINGHAASYTVAEDQTPEGYITETQGNNIINTHVPNSNISVPVKKVWDDDNNLDHLRPGSIFVNLLANGAVVAQHKVTAANGWHYTFTQLPEKINGHDVKYTVAEENVPDGYTASVDGDTITNHRVPTNPRTTHIVGHKTWDDDNNIDHLRPTSITVDLLASGRKVAQQTVTADNNWAYNFSNLPTSVNGKLMKYSVVEDKVPVGYTSLVNHDKDGNSYNITNVHVPTKPDTTSLVGHKIWDDFNNVDHLRPKSITVDLLDNGKKIDYTVAEDQVPAGYTSVAHQDGVNGNGGSNITNLHVPTKPNTTHINGQKIWQDQNNADGLRPNAITVDLLANGQVINKQTVTAANDWHYYFANLPTTDMQHQTIKYTVAEDQTPNGYTFKTDGNNIINMHVPNSKKHIVGHKIWQDEGNRDHLRPDSIVVDLFANDIMVAQQKVTADNGWRYSFTNLPENDNGKAITYRVGEDRRPAGYLSTVSGTNITNKHVPTKVMPKMTHIVGHKTWVDDNNVDGIRPTSITVDLLANGIMMQQRRVTAADHWQYVFDHLPETVDGHAIKYTVAEDRTAAGYTSQVSGDNITNSHTPTTPNNPPKTPNNPPKTPNTPPKTPNIPPKTPNTPTEPKRPHTPTKPKRPHTPTKPKRPHLPNLPNTYGHNPPKPGNPNTPGYPNLPNTYGNTPGNPTSPSRPGLPNTYGTSTQSGLPNTYGNSRQNVLPQTGERRVQALTVLGLLVMSMTCAALVYMKRRA